MTSPTLWRRLDNFEYIIKFHRFFSALKKDEKNDAHFFYWEHSTMLVVMVNEMRIIKFSSKDQLVVGFLFNFYSLKTVRHKKNIISVHMLAMSTHTQNQFPHLTESRKMSFSLLTPKERELFLCVSFISLTCYIFIW